MPFGFGSSYVERHETRLVPPVHRDMLEQAAPADSWP
jgi:hypothetical protein